MRMAEYGIRSLRAFGILRRTDNRVHVGPDLGGRRHKSPYMLYFRGAPTFREHTPQQNTIPKLGVICGFIAKGVIPGPKENWTARKIFFEECAPILSEYAGIHKGIGGENMLRAIDAFLNNPDKVKQALEALKQRLKVVYAAYNMMDVYNKVEAKINEILNNNVLFTQMIDIAKHARAGTGKQYKAKAA